LCVGAAEIQLSGAWTLCNSINDSIPINKLVGGLRDIIEWFNRNVSVKPFDQLKCA